MSNTLSEYMLTSNNIEYFKRNIIDNKPKKITKDIFKKSDFKSVSLNKIINDANVIDTNVIIDDNNKLIFDNSMVKDPFFWCLYVIKYGKHKYDSLNNKLIQEENNEKFNNIFNKINKLDDIPGLKDFLKINKITKTTIKNDLTESTTYTGKTSYKLAKVMCFLYNINIIVIENKTYFKVLVNTELDNSGDIDNLNEENSKVTDLVTDLVTNYNQITITENNEHVVTFNLTENSVKNITENYYEIDSFDKKIKGIGYYKVNELTEIANKLGINTSIKKKKQDLYNEIKIELKEE